MKLVVALSLQGSPNTGCIPLWPRVAAVAQTFPAVQALSLCPNRVADYVVLNKIDMMDAATTDSLTAIVASLNPLAQASDGTRRGTPALLGCL